MARTWLLLLLAGATALLSLFAFPASGAETTAGVEAAPAVDRRAEELARLRREVESLSTEVGLAKEELRSRLRTIEGQRSEVDVQLRREDLRLAQLEGEAQARRDQSAQRREQHEALAPTVIEAVAAVRDTVARSLPYRQTERLAELDTLKRQLVEGLIGPEAAAARLWAFVEDELRLTRENGLDRQVIVLGSGEEVLADVAHLGMAALYYRSDGGQYGVAVAGTDGWSWRAAGSRDEEKAIEALFGRLQHGVRSGAFSLPNPYAGRP